MCNSLGQSLIGNIRLDEAERVERRGTLRIVVISVVFILIGVVTDALDDEPADKGVVAHDQSESCAFHVDRNCATYWSTHILKRMVGTYGATRGHWLDMTFYFAPFLRLLYVMLLSLFGRRGRALQSGNERFPLVE